MDPGVSTLSLCGVSLSGSRGRKPRLSIKEPLQGFRSAAKFLPNPSSSKHLLGVQDGWMIQ